jgi:hypothetical protein
MFYAVSCGEALHIIPAQGHEQPEDGSLIVHGAEDHSYGPSDWDLVIWEDSRESLLDIVGRVRLAPRLQV